MNPHLRDELIMRYLPAVAQCARRFLGNSHYDDLCGEARLALCKAVEKFTPDREATFGGYLHLRITGAMRDYLRRIDPTPCRERAKAAKGLAAAIVRLDSMDAALTDEGLTLHEFIQCDPWQTDMDREAFNHAMSEMHHVAGRLGAMERAVFKGLCAGQNLRMIAEGLGVTESRVCQIKSSLIEKIARTMKGRIL